MCVCVCTPLQPLAWKSLTRSPLDLASYMYQQIVFGQLGSYAMNMRAFGMPHERERQLVQRLGEGNGLPEQTMQVLFANASTQE